MRRHLGVQWRWVQASSVQSWQRNISSNCTCTVFAAGQVTLNLYGGKFYKGGDKGSSSIWDRRPGHKGTKSRLSNLKSTFFTPIGTQSTYKRSKAPRKYCLEEDQTVSSFQRKSTI